MAEKKKNRSNWLLWWNVDTQQVATAVAAYETRNPFKSPRGIAACCFVFSAALTIALHLAKSAPTGGFGDAVVLVVLALFIYLGHRWAMLAGMAWWTLGKLALVYAMLQASSANGSLLVTNLIWWCVYMHALWLAFMVEQARRKPSAAVASVFD